MLQLASCVVLATLVAQLINSAVAMAQVVPQKASDIVVRPINIQQVTPACTPDLEIGFLGLTVPPNQVLVLTGLFWGASWQPMVTVEADLYVTDGTPANRRNIGRVSGKTGADGHFSGIQEFPVPVPLFKGTFTHLCIHNVKTGSVLGTSTFVIYGFFTPDQ
jgi:hypothetical protein